MQQTSRETCILQHQLLEIGIPVVIALNMVDLLKKNNIHINVKGLSSALGCPIVETSALKGTGLKEVVDEAIKCANQHRVPSKQMEFPKAVEKAVNEIERSFLQTSLRRTRDGMQ